MNITDTEPSLEIWGHQQLMCVSGLETDSPWTDALLVRQTHQQGAGLLICMPGELELCFPEGKPSEISFSGESFSLEVGMASITGAMPDPYHLLLEGPVTMGTPDPSLQVAQRGERILVGVAARFDRSLLDLADLTDLHRERMNDLEKIPVPAGLDAQGRSTYRKAVLLMRSQVYSPEGIIRHRWTTPERWPHRDMWLWDSVFHALGWRHLDPVMARDCISAVFDCQNSDGFIPHRMTPQGEASNFTQPPLLAYAVEALHQTTPAPEWVRELYPKLRAYLEWDLENRDRDGGGLLEWHIEELENCRSGESGADNSPRFDPAKHIDAVDFNAYIASEFECMARLASIAGHPEDAPAWTALAREMNTRINQKLWDEGNGFYFDFDPDRNDFHRVWASSGFMPLFSGAATADQAGKLAGQLSTGGKFDTALPVASVAPSDPAYIQDMWRGPSWLSHSWLIAEGLSRYGYDKHAELIRERWMKVLERDHAAYGTFFEYYDSEDRLRPLELLRKGKNGDAFPHQSIHYFGWTATLYVDWCHRFHT